MTPTQDDETLRDLFARNLRDEENVWEQPPDKGPIPASAVEEYASGYIPPLIRLPKAEKPVPAPVPDEAPLPVPPPEEEQKDAGVGEAFASLPVDTAGAGGDAGAVAPPAPPKEDEPDLSYETWLTSHPQKPTGDNYSWLARAGETANAAGVGRKPDYGWVNKLDEEGAAKAAAPQKAYGQWLLAQKTQSEITKNNREREAPSVSANIKAGSAERIADKKNRLVELERQAKYAQGAQKLALERDIAGLRADIAFAGQANQAGIAKDNRAAAEARFQATQNLTEDKEARKSIPGELSDAMTALKDFKQLGPQALADVGWWDRLLRAAPFGAGEAFIDPAKMSTMSKEDSFRAFQTRMETGLAMTDSERADSRKRFGLNVFSNPALFQDMITYYENLGNARAAQKQAGMSGRALGKFAGAGGYVAPSAARAVGVTTASAPAAPDTEPDLQPGEVLMEAPDGSHRAVSEDDAEEAEAAGYRRL